MESKLLTDIQIKKLKQDAEKVASEFGYNATSLNIDVINVKDAYCHGYANCYRENLTVINAHDELVNVLKAYKNMVGNTGYSIAKEEAKYLYDIATKLLEKII